MRQSGGKTKIILQERDIALLRTFLECRIMTAAHVAAIHFHGRAEMAKKRLQKLKAASLLGERRRQPTERAVLYLLKPGLDVLKARGLLENYPIQNLRALERRLEVSDRTIEHELAVMDVKAAFHAALRPSDRYRLVEFSTWPRLHEFTVPSEAASGRTVVRPDGFIRIQETTLDGGFEEHSFFLEVDHSTETLDRLARRAAHYVYHYRSGDYARTRGTLGSTPKDHPFRILMVFKTPERRKNMVERLLRVEPPVLTQACLANMSDVTLDAIGPIWVVPRNHARNLKTTLLRA